MVKESKSVTVRPQRLSDANMHVAQTKSERINGASCRGCRLPPAALIAASGSDVQRDPSGLQGSKPSLQEGAGGADRAVSDASQLHPRPASLPLQASLRAYCSPPSTPQTCGSTQNQPQQSENRLVEPVRAHPDPHRSDSGDGGSLPEEQVWHMGKEAVETDGRCRQGHSGDNRLGCVNREQPQETGRSGETGQPCPQQRPLHSIQVVGREGCWLS